MFPPSFPRPDQPNPSFRLHPMVTVVLGLAPYPTAAGAQQAQEPRYETIVQAPARPLTPGSRSVGRETLATTPLGSGDDLLRVVPGLFVSRHGAEGKSTQLFLRGFDAVHGADVEVLVDGLPWNEASNVHGQGYLDLAPIPPEAVRRVDVQKGALRLDQGPFATAGTVRFVLGLGPDTPRLRTGYELGSTNRHRVHAALAGDGGHSFILAEGLHDGGFGQNRRSERVGLVSRLRLIARAGQALILTVGGHAGRFGEPGLVPLADQRAGRFGFYDSPSPDTDGDSARAFAALRWSGEGKQTRSHATLYAQARRLRLQENFTGYLLDVERGDRLEQAHAFVQAGVRLGHARPLGRRLRLLVGADLKADRLAQHEDHIDAALTPFARSRDLRATLFGAAAHAGLRWLPHPSFRLEGGMRAETFGLAARDRITGDDATTVLPVLLPRATFTLYPTTRLSLLGGYGRGVRPPEARAVPASDAPSSPDSDLRRYRGGSARPTTADGAELGVRYQHPVWFDAGLGVFATRVGREQVFDHVSATNLELGTTRRVGIEVDATVRPFAWLLLRADGTFVDARFEASDRPVPGAPTQVLTVEAHASGLGGFAGGARVLAIGPRQLAHGARAGALAVVDLVARYRHGPFELSLTVENVADSRTQAGVFNFASHWDRTAPAGAIPRIHYAAGPPRTVLLGLAVEL